MNRLTFTVFLLISTTVLVAQDRLPTNTRLDYSRPFQISPAELRDTSLTFSFDGTTVQIPNIKEGHGQNIRPSGVINITDFGAIPNDGIDDTQAIIKAYTTLVRAAENVHNDFYFDYYRADFNRDGKYGAYNAAALSEFGPSAYGFAGVDLNGNGILETAISSLPEVADMNGNGRTRNPDGTVEMVSVQSVDRDGNVITIQLPEERDLNHNYVIDPSVSVAKADVEEIFRGYNDPRFMDGYSLSYALYIPDGVWDISDTIIFDGPEPVPAQRQHGAEGAPGVTNIRIYGQSRAAILRLADNSPGFDNPAEPKPILAFSKLYDVGNAWRTTNMLRNLTIQTGDNPGAYGLFFMGANNTGIRNVTLEGRTNKPSNGVFGIKFSSAGTIGYHYDITINGFQYGMYLTPYDNAIQSLEHITLKNQTVSGIHLTDSTASIRKVLSQQTVPGVPALRLEKSAAHAVILDSTLEGTGPAAVVLDHDFQAAYGTTYNEFGTGGQHFNGHAFCRDLTVTGYDNAAQVDEGASKRFAPIRSLPWEWVSDLRSTYKDHRATDRGVSLRLPIEDVPQPIVPVFGDANPNVAIVDDYYQQADGTVLFDLDGNLDNRVPDPDPSELYEPGDELPNYTAAIDRALTSGRPIVFFPNQIYRSTGTPGQISRTLVPASVKQLIGFFGETLAVPTWLIEPSTQPNDAIIIDDFWTSGNVIVRAGNSGSGTYTRPVVINHSKGTVARGETANSGVKIFINNGNSYGGTLTGLNNTESLWMRMVDTENGGKTETSARVLWNADNNTKMWCLGFKMEGGFTSFQAAQSAQVEVLGGALLQQSLLELNTVGIDQAKLPQFRIDESNGSTPAAKLSVIATAGGPSPDYFTRIIERRKSTFTTKYPNVLPLANSPAETDTKIEVTTRLSLVPRKALYESGNLAGLPISKNHVIPLFSTQQGSIAPVLWLESPRGKTLVGAPGTRVIAFADQSVGSPAPSRDLRINNIGTSVLTITSASITGGHTSDFSLNTTGMFTPVPLETGSSPLVVNFTPTATGLRQATLTLITNDPAEPIITITLQGTGYTPMTIMTLSLTGTDYTLTNV